MRESTRKRLEELERRVRELEVGPVIYPPVLVPSQHMPVDVSPDPDVLRPIWMSNGVPVI